MTSSLPVIPPELPPIPPYRTFHCSGGETKESKLLTEEYNRKSEQWNKDVKKYEVGDKKTKQNKIDELVDIPSDVIIEQIFTTERTDLPGNILNIHFSDGSGYKVTLLNNSTPLNIAQQLNSAVTHILSRI